ncbi:MAG: ATP synthase F0 subunit B [Deltaproteobacteria bacterium]|nr:ATP synthase F0 subunit B [Deltaproteobacteria bacterium]
MTHWMMSGKQLLFTLATSSAAEGGHHDTSINPYLLASVITNFIVFAVILIRVVRPSVGRALVARRTNMEHAMIEAKSKQNEAEARLRELQYKLDHLEEEVQRIIRSYEAEAITDRDRLRQEADRSVERMAREADSTVEQEMRKAEHRIQQAALEATMRLSESIIRERLTDADQRRLTDQYIADLALPAPSSQENTR